MVTETEAELNTWPQIISYGGGNRNNQMIPLKYASHW